MSPVRPPAASAAGAVRPELAPISTTAAAMDVETRLTASPPQLFGSAKFAPNGDGAWAERWRSMGGNAAALSDWFRPIGVSRGGFPRCLQDHRAAGPQPQPPPAATPRTPPP